MAAFDLEFKDIVPSDDWELNLLLLEIANHLELDEFNKFKFLCTGTKGIPKGILSKLDTPEKFFTYLRERRMISRDNLLLLQAFLWHLDRKDLHEKAAEYARRVGDTLYFYAPKPSPENGFKHIQFHVDGNLDRFQRSDLEALRATVARLLFVPQEFIFLSGVEPSQSLKLTFLIHENYVTPLRHLFQEHQDSFVQLGVDGITVDGQDYIHKSSIARRTSAPAGAATERELRELFEKNLRLESWALENEVRVLESKEEIKCAQKEAVKWQRRESYFRSLLISALNKETSVTDVLKQHPSLV
ncbi:hypothetical protein BsWGS_12712 [Bradybaena similaris]